MKTSFLLFALALGIGQAQASDGAKTVKNHAHAPAVRNIISTQLPAKLLTSIKKNYRNYWITDLYTQNLNGKASYFITLENPDRTVKLNATRSAGWSIIRVVPKDISAR
ncbi:MAG TPA: hypothetical protein VGR89_07150 [Puia sp.]|nr:hypothetical protein [Puia sp.]